ncbi:MAG: carboxypeptidase-like regulatory domain-containing protein, partial [Bacteroidia bacterium]|nr:carboxypeptidase-like regulatory domain-containing protein [Bacteroidia bacterium]
FSEVENDYSVVIGELSTKDNAAINYGDVFISVSNNNSREIVGNYLPNPATGRFVVILPPGKYQMRIEAPGYKTYTRNMEIYDKASYQAEIDTKIELSR